MKKLISTIATLTLTSTSATPLLACTPDNSLKITFVPSRDSTQVMKIVKPLEGLLKNEIHRIDPNFNQNVKITTTSDYERAGQTLMDGKTALAFLPMGTYTKYWGNEITPGSGNYSAAAPLLIAQRYAMKPEVHESVSSSIIDYNQEKALVKDYNDWSNGIKTKDEAYQKLYTNASDKESASSYRSEVLISNKFLARAGIAKDDLFSSDENHYQGLIQKLIKKSISEGQSKIELLVSNTSGAGVIYPTQWMLNNGMSKKEVLDILQHQARANSYTQAAQDVANDATDITFGYTDIRADAEKIETDYANTTMIGLTEGILNDGIDYSKKTLKDPVLLNAIRQAFKNLIEDGKHKDIFDVYSHTDYDSPADGASADAVVKWEADQNKNFQKANKDIQPALELIAKI